MRITDLTPYRKYVDDFVLTEKQKLEWVNAVYEIVESIFDMHLDQPLSEPLRNTRPSKAEANSKNGS
jgi:hypothetical protein